MDEGRGGENVEVEDEEEDVEGRTPADLSFLACPPFFEIASILFATKRAY